MAGAPAVAVVGSVNLDLVAYCERLPRPGETLTGATFGRVPGGKGANQALAIAQLGAEVWLTGAVGSDSFDDEGENQIVVAPGANALVETGDLGPVDAVLCQLEISLDAVTAAAQQALFFCLNAAPARALPAELLAGVDLLVVNRYELEAVGRYEGLTALTLGAEGAVLLEGGEEVARAAPPPIEVVDGTAAGDAFTACLLVSLLEGRAREEALRRACAAGALAVSRPG